MHLVWAWLSPSAASSSSLLFLSQALAFRGSVSLKLTAYALCTEMGRTPPCHFLGSVQRKVLLVSELSVSSPSSLSRPTFERGQGWVRDRTTNQAWLMPVSILLHHAILMPQSAHAQSP